MLRAAPVASTEEPPGIRWRRRARTIPMMLGATVLALVTLPVSIPVLAGRDLVQGRRQLPSARVLLFLVRYGVNDCLEILLAPAYWTIAGFGRTLGSARSIRRHERIQRWSIATLARAADRRLGLRLDIDPDSIAALTPTPAIVLCRHVSLFDASLPSLLYQSADVSVRGVIMAELLADPGFDLFYRRSGSVFIPREHGDVARAAIATMRATLDSDAVVAIFPEGRLFRPELRDRFQAKIASSDPARAVRTDRLRHVLPPRPGGVLTLLDALPDADVVVIAHRGLDAHPTFAELARAVPLTRPVEVRVTRYARAEIPDDPAAQVTWLDERWCELDAWVGQRAG